MPPGKEDRMGSRKSGENASTSEESRPGLPDPSSIVAETVFVSPKGGRQYRILRTDEKDAYDPAEQPETKEQS
jgi:hypothetical protein